MINDQLAYTGIFVGALSGLNDYRYLVLVEEPLEKQQVLTCT